MNDETIIGVIIYDIHPIGNLTGIWTNTHHKKIYTEMCVKDDDAANTIIGNYRCSYYDDRKLLNNELSIKEENQTLLFEWRNGKNIIFQGIGLYITPTKIAVSFLVADNV